MDKFLTASDLDLFGMSDQPTTCPYCGARTDFIEVRDFQVHVCLNEECGAMFRTEDDEDDD